MHGHMNVKSMNAKFCFNVIKIGEITERNGKGKAIVIQIWTGP